MPYLRLGRIDAGFSGKPCNVIWPDGSFFSRCMLVSRWASHSSVNLFSATKWSIEQRDQRQILGDTACDFLGYPVRGQERIARRGHTSLFGTFALFTAANGFGESHEMSPRLAEALRRRRGLASQPFVSLRLSPSLSHAQMARVALLAKSEPDASLSACRRFRPSVKAALGASAAAPAVHQELVGRWAFCCRCLSMAELFPRFQRRDDSFCFSVGIGRLLGPAAHS